MDGKQLKIGAILSYVLIAVNSIYGLIITPFILGTLGVSEYGVYRTISSFSAPLIVMDMGIGSTVMRYAAKFYAEKDNERLENFSAMGMIQATIISLVIMAVSTLMYNFIDAMYSNSMTVSEIVKIKQLFVVLIINICLHVCENVISGIITGCNRFAFSNSVKLARLLFRIVLIYTVLAVSRNSLALVTIDLLLTVLTIFVEIVYLYKGLLLKIKYYFWDKLLFIESLKYSLLTFVQTVTLQLNGNVDNIVIGALIGPSAVAVYSIGLMLYSMYEQFAVAFSSLMLPTVTNQILAGASNRELEDTVIKVGRLQFAILGGALAGFAVIGKEFIDLWLGNDFSNAWIIALILIVPATVELIQNVCLSIIRAKNKLVFRTWALTIMAVFNLIITIVGVAHFGYLAAAVGTAIGLIGAHVIAMNIYYYRVLKINVLRIFAEIFRRTFACLALASIGLIVANIFIHGNWKEFLVKVTIFCLLYGFLMIMYGFNKSEKELLYSFKPRRIKYEN